MKKILFIFVITALCAGCKTKEERRIIGEWKLTDIIITLDSTTVAPNPWGYYLYDNSKSLTFTFYKDETFKLVKKDGSNSRIETGTYAIRSDLKWLILENWDSDAEDWWYSGIFEELILEKQELIFKSYVYSHNTTDFLNPSEYYIHIFKKVK